MFWVPSEARCNTSRSGPRQPEIGKLIDNALDLIEVDDPTMRAVLPKTFARPSLDVRPLGELVDLISGIGLGSAEHRGKDMPGRFASAEGKGGGEFYTPRSVVELLVEVIEALSGRAYDACCGSGSVFVEVTAAGATTSSSAARTRTTPPGGWP